MNYLLSIKEAPDNDNEIFIDQINVDVVCFKPQPEGGALYGNLDYNDLTDSEKQVVDSFMDLVKSKCS